MLVPRVGSRVVFSINFTRYPEKAVWAISHVPSRYDGKIGVVINAGTRMVVVKFKDGKSYELPLVLLRAMPKVARSKMEGYSRIQMMPSGSVWGTDKKTGKRVRVRRGKKW